MIALRPSCSGLAAPCPQTRWKSTPRGRSAAAAGLEATLPVQPAPDRLAGRFDGLDVLVGQAEVVADLVDEDVGDHLAQGHVAALAPFVEDRAAVEEDH